MKVWIAIEDYRNISVEDSYRDFSIVGVFSDAEKAKQVLEKDKPLTWYLQNDGDDWAADPRKDDPKKLWKYYVWAYEVE